MGVLRISLPIAAAMLVGGCASSQRNGGSPGATGAPSVSDSGSSSVPDSGSSSVSDSGSPGPSGSAPSDSGSRPESGSGDAGAASDSGSLSGFSGDGGACGNGTPAATDVVVDLTRGLQTMDGFGISTAFQSTALTDAQADQFFDPTKGIGISIFRLGIGSNGDTLGPWSDATKAAARGVVVWATPWSPPANCKSNDNVNDGGTLDTNCYDSWSTTLASFVALAQQDAGVQLMGISAQNEPENTTPYPSCVFTGAQMVAFVKVLGPKLKALTPPVQLLAPESASWADLWGNSPYDYGDAILADPTAAAAVDILATHEYITQVAVAPPAGVTKKIWETEMSGVEGYPESGPSSDITDGLVVAHWIYDGIVVGGASAWHWWWTQSLNPDNEGLLLQDGTITKRFYTMGNYSKFIRPGYQRMTIAGTIPSGIEITAYSNSSDGTVVIVADNPGTTAVSVSLFISGVAPCSMTPWVTSSSANLASGAAISVSQSRFSASLGAQTVTTFVGTP